ncbi:hypothetical protein EDC04DRAFT_3110447 [Pisolithus marmoratus]|nr:hypothetical protein EDC04DRAFT_3110447 [Pisolithus marmoratus]
MLYLHRISDNIVGGTPLRNYNMFKQLCGKDNFKNVIFVSTMWDEVTIEIGSMRERGLQSGFWRSMISLGSTVHRFDGTMESAWKIIDSLSLAPPIQRRPLQIQREVVGEHVRLARVTSTCAKSMRLVCDVLRVRKKTQSCSPVDDCLQSTQRGVLASFGMLVRGLKIDSNSYGIPGELVQPISSAGLGIIRSSRFTENDYVIFVVGPAEAGKSWFAMKLFEDHDIPVVKVRQHVKALRCNLIRSPANIIVVSIPSFHTDHEASGAENTVISWLKSSFSEKCHSGILLLHSLDSDPTDGSMLMTRHLEAFAKAFPNRFTVPTRLYVVPTSKPAYTLLSGLTERLSQLEPTVQTLNGNRSRNWHASMFPGVFQGQPEIAWNAALLLLKDMTASETQANELLTFPRAALRHMPAPSRLALNDLSNHLLREFRKKRGSDLDALIAFARIALDFTPPDHPLCHSALINLASLLCERSKKEYTQADLDEAIALRRAAWKCMLPDNPERQTLLPELDGCLYERFKRGGAMVDLEEIVSLRRIALERTSPLNRSRQLLNLADSLVDKFEKVGLVTDVKEAIDLGRTALELCPPGHPDHALSQHCLANYLDAKTRKRCARARIMEVGNDSSSINIKQSIRKIAFEVLETIPLRLLHTPTGVLCSRDLQLSHFERSPQYRELLSLMSTCDSQPSAAQVYAAVNMFFRFATLSHRWATGEPLLRNVEGTSIYDLDGGDGLEKLQRFCAVTLRRGFSWAWADTCCIDKDSSAELQEAIGSMFSWYHRSSLTIVFLSDVSNAGLLANSVWFERGWTLQELLASHTILFYTQDWTPYMNHESVNHKTDPALLEDLHKATEIAKPHLTNFYPGMDDARSRLRWASGRRTTRPEDIAYSLFGIFKVHLPILYGESAEHALGRLLAEIILGSGDVSVLDWVGEASSFNSCFPANLVPYQTVPRIQRIPSDPARRNDLDFEKSQKLYSKLAGLPRAGFVNNKLMLPCIIHQVTEVRPQCSPSSSSRYTYEIHGSRLTPLEVALSVNLNEDAGRYILVRPWHPKALPMQTDRNDNAVWELLAQLEQPFHALLLEKLPYNEYRRVASECMITACPQDVHSILDSQVLIPEIV